MKKLFIVGLIVALAILLMGAAPSPLRSMSEIPETFGALVAWLALPSTGGIILATGLKQWTWYQSRKRWAKWSIALGMALVFTIGIKCAMLFIPGSPFPAPTYVTAWEFLEFWYPVVAQGLIVFVASGVWNDKYINSLPVEKQGSFFN